MNKPSLSASIAAALCTACVEESVDVGGHRTFSRPSAIDGQPEAEVVFERVRTLDEQGRELGRTELGALDRHQWRKAARPDPLTDGDYLYTEEARLEPAGDGTVLSTLTYRRALNLIEEAPAEPRPPKLAHPEELVSRNDGAVYVGLAIEGFPAWDVPLEIPQGFFSADEEAAGARERENGYAAREALFEAMRRPIDSFVEELGGRLGESSWSGGWVGAFVPVDRLEALVASPLLRRVWTLDGKGGSHAWIVGEAGQATRYNTDLFNAAGYDGADAVIGIIELGRLDDEACFQYVGANCTGASRLLTRWQCNNPYPIPAGSCDPVSNIDDLADAASDVAHATTVASLATADYTERQGSGHQLGDEGWIAGDHSGTWEARSTSIAPKVRFRFAGGIPDFGFAQAAEAVSDMSASSTRVINSSWSMGGGICSPGAEGPVDEAVEDAFDDARLMVFSAGNDPNEDANPFGSCDVDGHGALPKAFAVNALNPATCEGDYQEACQIYVVSAANGGADAQTPGPVTRTGALSLISMAAVDAALYRTDTVCYDPASRGLVRDGVPTGPSCGESGIGSSFAAPIVTAAAALVYEWGRDVFGPTPVDGVGKLHALMLGMGDSHDLDSGDSLTEQRTTRADRRFGMGRLKVKKPTTALLTAATLTDGSNQATFNINSAVFPSGTDFLKCVALQHEDMSTKTTISDVTLRVELRSPGLSCALGTTLHSFDDDTGFDVKSMVAIRSSSLVGKCARATLYANEVAGTSVTTSLFCYASTEDDDEPN